MIYVHKDALGTFLANNLEKIGKNFVVIEDLNEVKDLKSEIILKPKRDSYCRPCPATKVYNCCNYHNTDVIEGCPYDCSYCILQAYLGHSNIQISADTQAIVNTLQTVVKAGTKRRIGTGELSDSLALDHLFPYSTIISPIINDQEVIQFEYKTKSANINNLLNLNPKNIVVSWSLNPQNVVESEETGAAKVADRIKAAAKCAEAGYKVGFHFDPVVYYENYQHDYTDLIHELVNIIPEKSVEFISISTFRATSELIDKMRERKTLSKLLQGDFISGLDGKIRYFKALRIEMIRTIADNLRKNWGKAFIYLCMEHASIWEKVLGCSAGDREDVESMFPWYK